MYSRFAELLRERGITANTVAKATGITSSTFTEWKKGTYKPKIEKLKKIADFFGISVTEFI